MPTKIAPGGTAGRVSATTMGVRGRKWSGFDAAGNSVKIATTRMGEPKFANRSDITSGKRGVFRGAASVYQVDITLQGWRTLVVHHAAVSAIMESLVAQVTFQAGLFVVESALDDSTFQDRTGDTRRSIATGPHMSVGGTDIIASMGPDTFYAPFLEYGFHKGGNYYIFPTMVPALEKHRIDFINGLIDAAGIAVGERPYVFRSPMNQSGAQTVLSKARKYLYSQAKFLGDVSVFGGGKFLSPIRASLYTMAKELGDLSAIMGGTVGTRVTTRLRGSFTARALGKTRTISVDKSYSANVGGSGSHGISSRIYNRVAGRVSRPLAIGR